MLSNTCRWSSRITSTPVTIGQRPPVEILYLLHIFGISPLARIDNPEYYLLLAGAVVLAMSMSWVDVLCHAVETRSSSRAPELCAVVSTNAAPNSGAFPVGLASLSHK